MEYTTLNHTGMEDLKTELLICTGFLYYTDEGENSYGWDCFP